MLQKPPSKTPQKSFKITHTHKKTENKQKLKTTTKTKTTKQRTTTKRTQYNYLQKIIVKVSLKKTKQHLKTDKKNKDFLEIKF